MDYIRRVVATWGTGQTKRTTPRWLGRVRRWRNTLVDDLVDFHNEVVAGGPLYRAVLISGTGGHSTLVVEERTVDACGTDAWVEVDEDDETWVDFLATALAKLEQEKIDL